MNLKTFITKTLSSGPIVALQVMAVLAVIKRLWEGVGLPWDGAVARLWGMVVTAILCVLYLFQAQGQLDLSVWYLLMREAWNIVAPQLPEV